SSVPTRRSIMQASWFVAPGLAVLFGASVLAACSSNASSGSGNGGGGAGAGAGGGAATSGSQTSSTGATSNGSTSAGSQSTSSSSSSSSGTGGDECSAKADYDTCDDCECAKNQAGCDKYDALEDANCICGDGSPCGAACAASYCKDLDADTAC